MGFFSKAKELGSLEFGFTEDNRVTVLDGIPPGGDFIPNDVLYPFLFVGKLLYNFPAGSGQGVAAGALARLSERLTSLGSESLEDLNVSLFDMCSAGFGWAETGREVRWKYRGDYFPMNDGTVRIETHFSTGRFDELHRAAIDAAFDYARHRAGKLGGAVVIGAGGLMSNTAEHGIPNPMAPLIRARSAAALVAQVMETGELPF
ncbi:MAG: hypothetical protein IBX63_09905 [Coriobacteriia bacterium]|nr:hypothetical protein [Coriobacteriia bacterium]